MKGTNKWGTEGGLTSGTSMQREGHYRVVRLRSTQGWDKGWGRGALRASGGHVVGSFGFGPRQNNYSLNGPQA